MPRRRSPRCWQSLPDGRPAAATSTRAAILRAACREEAMTDAGPYAEINAAVRAALPADAVLTGDSSQVTYFGSVHFFDLPAPRRFCYSPGFATLGYGLPAGPGRSDRATWRTGGGAARRRRADVLRAGTDDACGTTTFGTSHRRGQRRLPGDPRSGGRPRHPADRGRTAHPGSGGPGRRDGRATASAPPRPPICPTSSAPPSVPTARPSFTSTSAERISHHGYRRRRHLSRRHDRVRLLG